MGPRPTINLEPDLHNPEEAVCQGRPGLYMNQPYKSSDHIHTTATCDIKGKAGAVQTPF